MDTQITHLEVAFKMALMLAITAPTEKQSLEAVNLAETFAQDLSPETVERIKRELEAA
jgi:hypothetical protein